MVCMSAAFNVELLLFSEKGAVLSKLPHGDKELLGQTCFL